MKLSLFGLLLLCITPTVLCQGDTEDIPGEAKDDADIPASWLDILSKLSQILNDKNNKPDITTPTSQSYPDQPIDHQTVNDDNNVEGTDVATTVVYEYVNGTKFWEDEDDGIPHPDTVSPFISVLDGVENGDNSSADSTNSLSINNEEAEPPSNQTSFTDSNLTLQEALAILRDRNQENNFHDQQDGDEERQETPQNSTDLHIDNVLDHISEETSLSRLYYHQDSTTETNQSISDDRNRTVDIEDVASATANPKKYNYTMVLTNASSSTPEVFGENASRTDMTERPSMETSPLLEVNTTSLESGQGETQQSDNLTLQNMSSTAVGSTSSSSSGNLKQYTYKTEDEGVSQSSTGNSVEPSFEASVEPTPTELPPQFWVVNDKGDDNDSMSKEKDIYSELLPATVEGSTDTLKDNTTQKCDWMGKSNNNAFINLVDKICHLLRPLPIFFNILMLMILGIMTVVVCWLICLCVRCRRRRHRKGGEEKDSLIEEGTRKEKRSLLYQFS
ncbi:protein MTL1-like [Lytechinus variegatus]|uniref:protein MTL1-like n=1 Tax=Lytechinus variegatus TaxID=7654 RepID=UPI001BB2387C|nr:protein MTL1-like [Lytechinus variegatus]